MHCEDPGCLKACPAPGAIVQYANGIVDFVHGELHRLRLLREGMPVQHPAHLPGRPQGLQVHAVLRPGGRRPGAGLRQGLPDARHHASAPRTEMIALRRQRIADLKSRGFDKAGLYNPPGVSGTHVMYVLHHADQPQLYAGLPDNPRISPIVEAVEGRRQVRRHGGHRPHGRGGLRPPHPARAPTASPRRTRRTRTSSREASRERPEQGAASTFVCAAIREAPASTTGSWPSASCCCC